MAVVRAIKRFEVWLVALDPTRGAEIQKTRPCLVVSPDEMNGHLRTVIVAPMTTTNRPYPTRIAIHFQGKNGQIALDQIRTIDKGRLVRRVGKIDAKRAESVCAMLAEMFAHS
jgi:mRNA interferase MazF